MQYPPPHKSWKHIFSQLPLREQEALYAKYPKELFSAWNFIGRREQFSPLLDWSIWLYMAGRGAGKTRTGAEWVIDNIKNGVMRVALVAPTAADARDVMIEGESGIISVSPSYLKPKYEITKRRLTWPTGAIATVYSAEEPDRLRGPQQEIAWCDEIATWRYLKKAWDNLLLGTRLGQKAQIFASTTPRPLQLIKELVKQARDPKSSVVLSSGSTYDNIENLAPLFREQILSSYEGTRLGRQEIGGELLEDYEGALWGYTLLDQCRMWEVKDLVEIVVAIDPAASVTAESGETGIIGAGRTAMRKGVLLADKSFKGRPHEWAAKAIALYYELGANRIVAEKNQGGDMVENTIKSLDPEVPVKLVHASKGKVIRAEPISTLYENGSIFHNGVFRDLEDQMCSFVPGDTSGPLDRLDAMVWAFTDLMLGQRKRAGTWGRSRAA